MNKISVARNTLIVTALIAAGALMMAGCGKNKPAGESEAATARNHGGIAFVELDSVIANFDMAKDKATELEEKTKNSEAELASKSQAFDRDVRDFQNKVQKGLVTRATAAEMEQTLQQQQQTLLARRDEMAYSLNEESLVAQRQVLEYINTYLVEFNADRGFQYILAKQFPGPILFSDSSLDVTADVIAGLNARYNAEKAKK
ncbi:MAG: OmpH family outer membrane protein [Bacteroidales bacterium]|jgi:outer membrane protein|nr:OmpH family outer membrane protein [Bacteroidales bacterium]